MKFHLSPEQVSIQDSVRQTLRDTFPSQRMHQLIDGDEEVDPKSWSALMALGLGGLAVPEAFGGSGLGLLDTALAIEVTGEGAVSGPIIPHLMATLALDDPRDAPLRARWLGRLASGGAVATIAFGGGWWPDEWSVVEVDGHVRGDARFVLGAGAANIFLVGLATGGLALVEAGAKVGIERLASADGTRRLSRVIFNDAPAVRLHADPERVFDAGLILVAADALGGGQRLADMSVAYAKERVQFGQPIGRFQALKHQLATMALEIESARGLVWYAAHAWDRQLPDARRVAAISKAHLVDRFVSVARSAVAAHGGIGYTWAHDAGVFLRRALFDSAFLGGPREHRARAAAMAGWHC